MGHGKVGQGRLAKQEVAFLAAQLLLQPRHKGRPLLLRLLQRQTAGTAAAEQTGTVGHKAFDRLWRQSCKAHRDRLGLEHQAHRMLEQHRVGPLRDAGNIEFLAFGKQRRRGFFCFQTARDQRRVAINIGADLQHRGLAVATGEGGQIGFGHHRRDQYRMPGQLFEAEQQASLLSKRRVRVVMQNQLVHGALRAAGKNPAYPCSLRWPSHSG